ncbi:hypothetical protein V5O48_008036 [Marasmius crinis-equi]|uniref:Nuclear GTPase SLIP-GC n=1 Tax=Marasmius crinis-equi TaxID=585013 RepID=A0ABR3FFR3_9AGAR
MLREEVWAGQLEAMKKKAMPSTVIAVCGATGAGKSSLLNGILDVNVLPTSGMRACTAVVTEVSYHEESSIHAEVEFMTHDEWKGEINILRDALDSGGSSNFRKTGLKTPAGIALHRLKSAYPELSPEKVANMTTEEIMALNPDVLNVLQSTQKIVAEDYESFSRKMACYVDSERGHSIPGVEEPVYWPLIRVVRIRCRAPCLSTGAILVDLPGVGDSNIARNNVAVAYMKKAQYFWVIAPITRAVDDGAARELLGKAFKLQLMMGEFRSSDLDGPRLSMISITNQLFSDGNYDDRAITFIASKTDDISVPEIIKQLDLHEVMAFQGLERQICQIKEEIEALNVKLEEIDNKITTLEQRIPDANPNTEDNWSEGKHLDQTKHSTGKRKNPPAPEDERPRKVPRMLGLTATFCATMASFAGERFFQYGSGGGEDAAPQIEGTGSSVVDTLHHELSRARSAKSCLAGQSDSLRHELDILQKKKKSLCATVRNDFSKRRLQEDFRLGIKEVDDSYMQQSDPDNFDPDEDLRDYEKIQLPVFTCSSRDYQRLRKLVRDDEAAVCFSNVEDTGIPGLQDWCHQLTSASRVKTARNLFSSVKALCTSLNAYIEDSGTIPDVDCVSLRERWASNSSSEPHGIANRLQKEFKEIIDVCVTEFHAQLKRALGERCRFAVVVASESTVDIADKFGDGMHPNTYRAAIRHHGCFEGRDWNEELLHPFLHHVAPVWRRLFEEDFFAPFQAAITKVISNLLNEVESSTSNPQLKHKLNKQRGACIEDAKYTFADAFDIFRRAVKEEKKEMSRSILPRVKLQLEPGYTSASSIKGKGCVKKQEQLLHDFVSEHKDSIFEDSSKAIVETGLTGLAKAISTKVCEPFEKLAKKIEVDLSVSWDHTGTEDEDELAARVNAALVVGSILKQTELWLEAEANIDEEKEIEERLLDVAKLLHRASP